MENAIQSRINSLDKFKSLQQRRRRMSIVAPINDRRTTSDFEQRIAICKLKFSYDRTNCNTSFPLVDKDFRKAIFKLTAMLIYSVDTTGKIRIKMFFHQTTIKI